MAILNTCRKQQGWAGFTLVFNNKNKENVYHTILLMNDFFLSLILITQSRTMRHIALFLVLVAAIGSIADEKKEKNQELGTVIGIDLGTTYSW